MTVDGDTIGKTDTIAAISTAPGAGAIGIVRMSGPSARSIAGRVFQAARLSSLDQLESHRFVYGHIVRPGERVPLDEVLLVYMEAPATYTREDVVEIFCHGGGAAQRAVLELLLEQGARVADPGEFTKRAFLNGRIDLAQAESVASIVAAHSQSALRASVHQLQGGLSARVREIRARLLQQLALVEAGLDFADEELEPPRWDAVVKELRTAKEQLLQLDSTAFLGRVLETGLRTAIVGRPNVGKSSLLNALLARERAIVSEIPGTTRDTVEELVEIGGVAVRLVDTAGLRENPGEIEALGVSRSWQALEGADLVLIVLDLIDGVLPEDKALCTAVDLNRAIIVANKLDAGRKNVHITAECMGELAPGCPAVPVSALTGEGVEALRQAITEYVLGSGGTGLEEPMLATERQRGLVRSAIHSVAAAESTLDLWAGSEEALYSPPEELVCEDLRTSIRSLDTLTGDELTPDLIESIFQTFCIGK